MPASAKIRPRPRAAPGPPAGHLHRVICAVGRSVLLGEEMRGIHTAALSG
jgi:hypothetical protein